jgi:hypothetical protein
MFTIDPIHPVYSAVVEMVAVYPNITVSELHAHLASKLKIQISQAQLYRVVTRMVDSQILIKVHGKLVLNLMWISYVEYIAGRAKRIAQHVDDFTLGMGEKRIYEARSLFDVESIWNHVLVSLYRKIQEKQLHKYYSHAWWQLGRNAEEISFYKQLKDRGIDCHWLFGSDSFLDRIGAERIREVFPATTTTSPPFPHDNYNLNVYGEYIIECILPEKISKHFAFFFEKVETLKEFDHDMFMDIFGMRGKYKVTVWRNKKQADALRAKLATYFPEGK